MKIPFPSRGMKRLLAVVIPLLLVALVIYLSSGRDPAGTTGHPQKKGREVVASPQAAFQQWLSSKSEIRNKEIPQGLALAQARRDYMVALIRKNPQQAIAESISYGQWADLPPEIQPWVEKPFSLIGNYDFYPVCAPPGTQLPPDAPEYVARLNLQDGTSLEAYVYGKRQELMSKRGLPVQGIMLGGVAAIMDGVFQKVELSPAITAQFQPAENGLETSSVTGQPVGASAIHALAGGQIFTFADEEEFQKTEDTLARLDALPGPVAASSALFLPKSADGSGVIDLTKIEGFAGQASSVWTETKKRLFLIRINFTDNTTVPVTQAAASTELNGPTSDRIREMSYGKTWIEATVSANVYTMPQTEAYYSVTSPDRNNLLLRDARNTFRNTKSGGDAAINIGAVDNGSTSDGGANGLGNYDIVGIYFTSIGMGSGGVTYAGLAGGSNLWVQDTNTTDLYTHELGHNYGLGHASFWQTSDGSVVGAGSSEEYGDIYDVMGDGQMPLAHYQPQAKAKLNWLTSSEWASASGSNTYRIYRVDDANTTTGSLRGVRVTKVATSGLEQYYWIGYRPSYAGNAHLQRGAYLTWQRVSQTRCWLLDTTPATSGVKEDAPIDMGRTYADTAANVYITPVADGGTGSQRYLDVRVNIGPFPGNAAPTAGSISGPSTLAARTSGTFSITATDSNSDTLAYNWNAGDGSVNDNAATITYGWATAGTYTLTATISDMKGGTATVTKTVTVTDPALTFTSRTSGTTNGLNAIANNGTTAVAVGDGVTIRTSTDGITWTARSISGSNAYFYGISWDGSKFVAVGTDYNFTISNWTGVIYTSADGTTWTRRYLGTTAGTELYGVAPNGSGGSVAVGHGGTILRTTDGISWSPVSVNTLTASHYLEGVAWNGSVYALVGYTFFNSNNANGGLQLYTSPDGTTWTDRSAGAGLLSWQDFRKIHWLNDRFVASGFYSGIRVSTDNGQTFTTTRTHRENTPAMAYGDGIYFTTGVDQDNNDTPLDVLSMNGVTWFSQAAPTTSARNGATFFKHTFITVGANGSIWQSGSTIPPDTFAAWQYSNFTNGGTNAFDTSDPDKDGLNNFLEYALARDPNTASGANGSPANGTALVSSGSVKLALDLPEPARSDVTYTVQSNATLAGAWTTIAQKTGTASWTWLGGGTSQIALGSASGGRIFTTIGQPTSTVGETKYFLRLQVSP